MRTIYIRLVRMLVLTSIAFLCYTRADAQRLVYRVDCSHISDHYLDVTVQLLDVRPDTLMFQMPVWSPGIYSTVNYGRFIHDVRAMDSSGNDFTVDHPSPCAWKAFDPGTISQMTYRVEDSRADGAAPEIGLARIDDSGVFANTEAIFGYFDDDKDIPGTIIFTMPKDWMVATTLEPATDGDLDGDARFHQNVFNFDDYSELADAPLLIAPEFQETDFTDNGTEYSIVAVGSNDFAIDSFAHAARLLIRAETSFYGNVPYAKYLFVVETGNGERRLEPFGIAHASSSVYTLPDADWSANAPAIQHLIAATLFKTWNGKRFHISPLGPIDFTTPIAAHSLWFSEGVSEYYAELLRVRYGLTSPSDFFAAIDTWERAAAGTESLSLDSLSAGMCKYDAARCECLRARGALAALMMDVEIRDKTKGRYSLDHVLLHMNRDAASGKTYDDDRFVKTLTLYSATDLTDFYAHCITSANTLPLEAYLEKIGAGRELPESMQTGDEFGLDLALNAAGNAILTATSNDSIVTDAPLKSGDTIIAIDSEKVTPAALMAAKTQLITGRPVLFTINRNAKLIPVTLRAKKTAVKHLALTPMKNATPEQIAMRKAMLGKRRVLKAKNPYRIAERMKD